jgi:inhibitor of cysteine peptidase
MAFADLCDKCKDRMYIMVIGQCSSCDGTTASKAFKLCAKCSQQQGKCQHCLASLRPAAEAPKPEKPKQPQKIDLTRSAEYQHGKWRYVLTVSLAGSKLGREGRLEYDGQAVPLGEPGDYYETPWGRMTIFPKKKLPVGNSGWIPLPPDEKPQGKLLLPPGLAVPLGQADNGKKFSVKLDQVLVVTLPGNPTTGYSWNVAELGGDALRQLGDVSYEQKAAPPGMVGVGGNFVCRLQAVKPGKATVKLVYKRPWEKQTPPEKTFSLEVTVEKD